jgi:hypothetical protein
MDATSSARLQSIPGGRWDDALAMERAVFKIAHGLPPGISVRVSYKPKGIYIFITNIFIIHLVKNTSNKNSLLQEGKDALWAQVISDYQCQIVAMYGSDEVYPGLRL